ncbi:hypothetical protein FRX31_027921 [Thalictrum thalictroides]|uniref:Uncharacterized protein n=1 Tax=Thalictrum thalictroides TaxID=46969 RepID=A0A7J6VDU5_THATH|nr:hypothetical protein FRX31_027921 [Thalictrum thalictroides]
MVVSSLHFILVHHTCALLIAINWTITITVAPQTRPPKLSPFTSKISFISIIFFSNFTIAANINNYIIISIFNIHRRFLAITTPSNTRYPIFNPWKTNTLYFVTNSIF